MVITVFLIFSFFTLEKGSARSFIIIIIVFIDVLLLYYYFIIIVFIDVYIYIKWNWCTEHSGAVKVSSYIDKKVCFFLQLYAFWGVE